MALRTHNAARWLIAILACLVALSAQSWASHVHLPTDDNGSAVGTTTEAPANTADNNVALDQSGDGHSDHCGHAGAHHVALRSEPIRAIGGAALVVLVTGRAAYKNVDHEPTLEPPIA